MKCKHRDFQMIARHTCIETWGDTFETMPRMLHALNQNDTDLYCYTYQSFKKWISFFWCSWSYEPQWVACKVNELIAYIYVHFCLSLVEKSPRRSHLPANIESTHNVCSNSGTASTFTTSNQIGEIHVFWRQVWITSRRVTQCCSWKYEHIWTSNGSSKEALEKCKYIFMNLA